MALTQISTQGIKDGTITGSDLATNVDLVDNQKIRFGTGNDLEIYHNGFTSIIGSASHTLAFYSDTHHIFHNANGSETLAKFIPNGAVELYHDNTKRLETDASGVKLSNGRFYSAGTFAFIESSDTATATLTLKKSASGADSIDYLQLRDSSNNIKLVISGSGDIDIEDNSKLKLGASDDLQIYHDGSHSYIKNTTGHLKIGDANVRIMNAACDEDMIHAVQNDRVELYFDGVKKFETTSAGTSVSGNLVVGTVTLDGGGLSLSDNDKLKCGNGDDLQIFHDGSDSIIDETGTGNLKIRNSGANKLTVDGNGIILDGKITTIGSGYGSTVFNEDGADVDFRIEGDTQASLFKVDAGNDRVGIGESDPTVVFHATQFNHAFADSTSSLATVPTKSVARFRGSNNASGSLFIGNESTAAKCYLQGCNETGNGSIDILLNPFGANVGIGTTSPSQLLHIKAGNPVLEIEGTASTTGDTGVFLNANGNHWFLRADNFGSQNVFSIKSGTPASSTHRLSVDSSGRVGIGTSSPSVTLDIEATTPTIRLTDSDASGTPESEIQGGGGDLVFSADRDDENSSTIIGFKVDGSERMRISTNGGLFLGLTGNVNSSTGMTCFRNISDNRRELMLGTTSTGNRGLIEFFNPNGGVGSINTTGSETQYNTNSDYRLKENVVAISDGITRLKTLKPSRFNFKADADKTVDGFLAHEVTAVPEAITGEKDAVVTQALVDSGEKEESELGDPVYQQIDQSKLVPLLVAAVQESISKIEVLETEVAALKAV